MAVLYGGEELEQPEKTMRERHTPIDRQRTYATVRMTTGDNAVGRGGDAKATLLLGETSLDGRHTSQEGGLSAIS